MDLIYKKLCTETGSGLLISMLEKLNRLYLTILITLVLVMWKWMDLFLGKNHLSRCWGWFSLLNWIEARTFSLLLNLPPRKLESWFILWSFLFLRLLFISINLPYSHAWNTVFWAGAPSCYLELLDKLQKPICRIVGPSLPFAHCQVVASLKFFYRYYFGRCSFEQAELIPFPFSWGSLLAILIDCMMFLSPFLDFTRMSLSMVSFFAQLDSNFCL